MNKKKIVDLFSGAGGLTEGFRGANFEVISHVEKEAAASLTLQLRDAYYYLKETSNIELYYSFLNQEITIEELFKNIPLQIINRTINSEIGDETIDSIFDSIDLDLNGTSVSGIIGGPPCQAYSTIGRAHNANKKATDGRIYLYRYYIEFLKKYNPEFFVFENVKGLLSFKDQDGELLFTDVKMLGEFHSIGYELDYRVVNTAEYGVPQKRERIIIFGSKDKELINNFFEIFDSLKQPAESVNELFRDLPKMFSGEKKTGYSDIPPSKLVSDFIRKTLDIPLTQNESRPNMARDLKVYKIVAEAKLKGKNIRYYELPMELKTHKREDVFLDRFKAIDGKGQAHTVVAHIAKDGHHYIHPDPKQNRSITVREAARLQTFPDDYYFENSRTSAFTQIGNAVSPLLSKKISEAITIALTKSDLNIKSKKQY